MYCFYIIKKVKTSRFTTIPTQKVFFKYLYISFDNITIVL